MDFFKRYSEAAQTQAKLAASSASKFAEQLGDQTKVLAEQASTFGKATAEQAQQRLKDLHLAEHLDKLAASHHQQQDQGKGPSLAELRQYGITPEFKDFVRSLTYSTFRDYPVDELDTPQPASTGREMHYLLPWQERHAMLIVQSVKEINELRFVLCPKRMTDEQFWKIYFNLTKKQLPDMAFDPTFVPEGFSQQPAPSNPLSSFDLQSKVQQLSSAAKQLGEETTARLRAAAGNLSSQSPKATVAKSPKYADDLGELASRGLPDKDGATATSSLSAHQGTDASVTSRDALTLDQDLDDYLKDSNQAGNGHEGGQNSSDEDQEGNDDFDKYINELEQGNDREGDHSGEDEAESSGEELDIDEYMKDLQAEEARNNKT
ncbi:hypothetical protein ABBQ38_008164 [Trebouxia sp. C0009 RCD-2024]